jgi:uncharacterized protein (TIGR02145 family)
MKKFLLSVFALSLTTAWGQSTTHISNLSLATGATPAITFDISWTAPPSATPSHRDSIWLFADFRTVNPDGTTGAWTPAGITSATIISGAGTLITSTLPGRGFFLDGHGLTTLNATIRITLDAPVNERFNACVYASDWPPNAILNAGGGYTLNGSPPFIINGTITEPSRTFGAGTCVTSITDATGCPGFVVNPPFAAGAIASTGETICEGGTPVAIGNATSPSGGDGSYTYEWKLNDAAIGSSNTPTWTPMAQSATTGSHTYTRWVKDGTCNTTLTQSAGSWILTVETDPYVSIYVAETICYNTTPAAMTATTSGGTGNTAYQWYSGTSSAAATTSIGGATASTYAPGALLTTTYYTVVATRAGSGCNAATATPIAKTVRENFSPGAISTTGQTICEGGVPANIGSATDPTGGDGTYTYEWKLNDAAIASSNTPTWTPTAQSATTGSHTYTRWVRDNICNTTFTQSAGSWILTVVADPTVSVSAAQTICYNTTPAAMTATTSNGTGGVSYQWYSGTSSAAATETIGSATANIYAPGSLTETTYYRAVATFTGSGCGAATAAAIAKTVRENFSPGAISTTGQTICEGGTPVAIGSETDASGGDGSYIYEWKLNDAAIGSSNTPTWTPTAQSATTGSHTYTRWVRDNICNTTFTQSAGSWILTVVPDPTVTVDSAEMVCSGTSPAPMTATVSGGIGSVSYQWYRGSSAAAVTTLISSATASTYAPTAITSTRFYTAAASFTGSGCNAATATAIAKTVQALSPGAITSSATTICEGGTASAMTATAPTGGNGVYTYQWKQGGNNATGEANSPSFIPSGTYLTTPGTYKFTRVITSCTSGTTSGTHTLISATDPTVTTTGPTRCGAGTVKLSATGSGTTTSATYSWIVGGAAAVTTSASYYNTNSLPTGSTTYSVTIRNSTGCSSTAANDTVTVVVAPTAPTSLTASTTSVCAGSAVTLTASGGSEGTGSLYQWGTGSVGSNIIDTTTDATYVVYPDAATTYWVRRINIICNTTTSGRTQTITTIATASIIDAAHIFCNSATTALLSASVSGATNPATYTWVVGTASAVTTSAKSYTATGLSTGSTTYSVTVRNSTGCTSAADTGTITIEVSLPSSNACAFAQPPSAGSFASFPNSYTASTYVTLTDERDSKQYAVVKIGTRWIMAQNLNYQLDLHHQTGAGLPHTNVLGDNGLPCRSSFWCPGEDGATYSSALYTCDTWGALYVWETAMSLDGTGTWQELGTDCSTDNIPANHPSCRTNAGISGRGICPPNWHVPTRYEWAVLMDAMEQGCGSGISTMHQNYIPRTANGVNVNRRAKANCTCSSSAGNCAMDYNNTSWQYHANSGTDNFHFRMLPTGFRSCYDGLFYNRGLAAYIWTSSRTAPADPYDAWFVQSMYNSNQIILTSENRAMGHSVRCIRDE